MWNSLHEWSCFNDGFSVEDKPFVNIWCLMIEAWGNSLQIVRTVFFFSSWVKAAEHKHCQRCHFTLKTVFHPHFSLVNTCTKEISQVQPQPEDTFHGRSRNLLQYLWPLQNLSNIHVKIKGQVQYICMNIFFKLGFCEGLSSSLCEILLSYSFISTSMKWKKGGGGGKAKFILFKTSIPLESSSLFPWRLPEVS